MSHDCDCPDCKEHDSRWALWRRDPESHDCTPHRAGRVCLWCGTPIGVSIDFDRALIANLSLAARETSRVRIEIRAAEIAAREVDGESVCSFGTEDEDRGWHQRSRGLVAQPATSEVLAGWLAREIYEHGRP